MDLQYAREGLVRTMLKLHGMSFRPCDSAREGDRDPRLGATRSRLVRQLLVESGLPESERGYSTRDLWTGERKKTRGDISAVVPPHGIVLYRVKAP